MTPADFYRILAQRQAGERMQLTNGPIEMVASAADARAARLALYILSIEPGLTAAELQAAAEAFQFWTVFFSALGFADQSPPARPGGESWFA